MVMRHCTEESNVDEDMLVIDASKIRHVIVSQGRIAEMSGLIEKATHLNLDFPDHKADLCVIAARLELGSPIKFTEGGVMFAIVPKTSYEHLGFVDYTARLFAMRDAMARAEAQAKESKP